jgi:hypothetical protein
MTEYQIEIVQNWLAICQSSPEKTTIDDVQMFQIVPLIHKEQEDGRE